MLTSHSARDLALLAVVVRGAQAAPVADVHIRREVALGAARTIVDRIDDRDLP